MAITVKHSKVSTIPDGDNTSVVRPSDWNSDHTLVGVGTSASLDAGVANGVATLDSGGKVPLSQIPALGDLSYQGTWNASTNTPTLTSSVGTKGYYYVVSVAGSTNLNGITDWLIGDWAVYNGTIWQKIDNTDAVTSVNGLIGTVVLTTSNVAEGTSLYYTDARARASVSAGTGISYDNSTGVITNSSPSLGGDVVGPASATDNAVARFDTTTGKLIQNSVVTINDAGAGTGFTTLSASTSVTTPIAQAINSAGLALKNASGTTQISMGAGGGDNATISVPLAITPTLGAVNISPTGTGTVTVNPAVAGTMNNMVIGGTTPLAITGTTITATSFVGSGASLTNVVNSLTASTGISVSGSTGAVTVTNTAPDQTVVLTGGTGISTSGTYPSFTVTNTAPDQTVALASGTGISVTGTYPNFTVTNTAPSSGGTVTSVTGTAPVVSSGGATPAISMPAATTSVNGYLTSTDWTTFNNKSNTSGTVTSVAALTLGTTGTDLSSTVATGTTTPVITLQVPTASATNRGALSAADWSTFNSKAPAVTYTTNYVPYGQGTTTPALSSSFTYDGTLKTLTAPQVSASNGLVVNSATVAASYTIPVGSSAMSVGPMTVASGQSVTVPSGSRWVVL